MSNLKDPKFKSNILLATYIVILAFLLINIEEVFRIFGSSIGMIKPFLIGVCIAFVFNIPMKLYEEKLLNKYIPNKKRVRPLSLIATILSIVCIFIALILFIIPQLIESGSTLANNIPEYLQSFEIFISEQVGNTEILNQVWEYIMSMGHNIITVIGQVASSFVGQILNITVGLTSTIINFFMGVLIAIYILLSKEKLALQCKKLLYACVSKEKGDKVLEIAALSNEKFSKFISGQVTEAFILGGLCFLGMLIFKMPYALLISTIIAITALVPIFGALIGTIPAAFIILMVSPKTALWFIVLIVVIQQIEGNLIYPLVVGNSIGLSAIWVLLAITIGGSTFGILGILIGIPLFGVLYSLGSTLVNKKIKDKDIKL